MLLLTNYVACEWGEERERGRGKREPVRMAKDFDFPSTSNLCHIQINYTDRKHNNNNS